MNPTQVRRQWAQRSGEYSPEYYAYYGPNEMSETVRRLLESHVGREASVLELGCSSGRHLSYLHEHGFSDLSGIEVNEDATAVMAEAYPALAADATLYINAIEDVIDGFEDDQFDAVYSIQTLQHVHPDSAWIFDELARITGALLVTIEHEGSAESEEHASNEGSAANKRSPESEEPAEIDGATDLDVSYVNDEFPIYHRNWGEIFTERGFTAVETDAERRETVRAFRAPSMDGDGTSR
ncbi:SAM-dependent methyltransferase [Halalkaliarchaeum desulfuricum]|uniref:SAM-dependent methyltransferase n=1 Tax=Halalkaliarchaeum desulfuricum TaxID=2055893 RepID=A0A343TK65_9EURY|nr:class I SAM-dependent methyltransferase [Halalkaliarchaeum desulfuricum]AUX09487.1 SAM-dependent methyltransferase [Halalkaliarchaeum desulfuricum]